LFRDYRCRVCGSDGGGKALNVDHDHKNHVVRGLLCYDDNHYARFVDADSTDDISACALAVARAAPESRLAKVLRYVSGEHLGIIPTRLPRWQEDRRENQREALQNKQTFAPTNAIHKEQQSFAGFLDRI